MEEAVFADVAFAPAPPFVAAVLVFLGFTGSAAGPLLALFFGLAGSAAFLGSRASACDAGGAAAAFLGVLAGFLGFVPVLLVFVLDGSTRFLGLAAAVEVSSVDPAVGLGVAVDLVEEVFVFGAVVEDLGLLVFGFAGPKEGSASADVDMVDETKVYSQTRGGCMYESYVRKCSVWLMGMSFACAILCDTNPSGVRLTNMLNGASMQGRCPWVHQVVPDSLPSSC